MIESRVIVNFNVNEKRSACHVWKAGPLAGVSTEKGVNICHMSCVGVDNRPLLALLAEEPKAETLPLVFNSTWSDDAKIELMRCFLRDLFAFLSAVAEKMGYRSLVCCSSSRGEESPFVEKTAKENRLEVLQIKDATRPRIFNTVQQQIFGAYAPPHLFLMDLYTPVFPEQYLEMGRRLLAGADAVFGPDPFGRFYLVGLKRPLDLFQTLKWDDPECFRNLVEGCRKVGLNVHLLPLWYSIKTAEDMAFLREHLDVKIANGTLKESSTLKFLESRGF